MSRFVFVRGGATWWPVKWLEPVDGGGAVEQSLEMRFRRLPWSEASAIPFAASAEFVRALAVDWRDIVDEAGREVPFEESAIVEMAGRLPFVEALVGAFFECLRAAPETRLGNSEPSPAGGQAAGVSTVPAPAAAGAKPAAKASGRHSKRSE